MRAMLRRQGFDLLVRRPTHREIWRLLVQRALYSGDERRREPRVPVGSEVDLDHPIEGTVLVDISNRGGRLISVEAVEPGSKISVTLPAHSAEGEALELRGEVVRSSPCGERHNLGVLFDRDLPESTRQRLGSLLDSWTRGGESLAHGDPTAIDPLPPCDSPAMPGLTLDAETDPAIIANVEVGMRRRASGDDADRRRHPRGPFAQSVEAMADSRRTVLIGRDLSAGGMRIEHLPGLDIGVGDRFEIAIYGPDGPEPFRVKSEVMRDDGEDGLALRFLEVAPTVADALEKLVACLPDVEPLSGDESSNLGTVITEIVEPPSGA